MVSEQVFAGHAEGFFTSLQQRGKSPHTLAAYRRDLGQLLALLAERPSENGRLGRHDFVNAFKRLSQKDLGAVSLARKLSVWRQYCVWLIKREMMEGDPFAGIRAPRRPERLPKALRQEPLNRMLDHAEADDSLEIRDRAIFELMYGSGLRLSELHDLNLGDLLLDEGWVSVRGKGGKSRRVPLVGKSIAAIREYLPLRAAAAGEQAVFTGRNGSRLGQRQIQKRLELWALRQGADQRISPHMMRHSYASHLLQSSRDIRGVQELLGHSNISTTQIYTKLDFDHLARVYDDAHPRAKRKK